MTGSGLGFPNCEIVDHWALMAQAIFDGEVIYLVGSAAVSSTYRDIDLRIIMDDEKYDGFFGKSHAHANVKSLKWSALCTAVSVWGQKATGLPIDFQVQRRSKVSDADWEKPRIPVGFGVVEGDIPTLRITPHDDAA